MCHRILPSGNGLLTKNHNVPGPPSYTRPAVYPVAMKQDEPALPDRARPGHAGHRSESALPLTEQPHGLGEAGWKGKKEK